MQSASNVIKRNIHRPAVALSLLVLALAGCQGAPPVPGPTAAESPNSPTASRTPLPATATLTVTPTPTATVTPGPSPTSTPLLPLAERSWQAAPVMIEVARVEDDPFNPFQYTPLLVLYGDGRLVQRRCEGDSCNYHQTLLVEEELCRLVNAINRTGFLSAPENAYSVPGATGAVVRLSVHFDEEKTVAVPDLDRWVSDPNWYLRETGCVTCSPTLIDPAVTALYRLLTTTAGEGRTGLETGRLAVSLSEPLIAGTPQPWDADLVPLQELDARAACSDGARQAAILEGSPATALADFLAGRGADAPLYEQDGQVWQVQSRWLLPYESPITCASPAGLIPPPVYPTYTWSCNPLMGAIPTSTPTITPTPTVTRTPIR